MYGVLYCIPMKANKEEQYEWKGAVFTVYSIHSVSTSFINFKISQLLSHKLS